MSLARTYARAFHESASKESEELSQLRGFSEILAASEVLQSALTSPMTSTPEKLAVLEQLSKKLKFSPLVLKFVSLLIRKNRLVHLVSIVRALEEVRIESEGGTLGQIVSADELGERDLLELSEAFKAVLGKKVDFRVSVDPNLLAGLKVTVEGKTFDGSLKGQFERARRLVVEGAGGGSSTKNNKGNS